MFSSGMSFGGFGGAGALGGGFGGGETTTQVMGEMTSSSSPLEVHQGGQGARKPRQEAKETCLPVTLRAIETALDRRGDSGEELRFYGVAEPQMILVVAAVESMARQAAQLEVTLNDGTGRMKGRWFLAEPQEGELERIASGTFVSLFGEVRASPVRHIAIKGMRPVESADEVSYHIIEAAHAALKLQTRGSTKEREPATPAKTKEPSGSAVAMASELTPEKAPQAPMEVVQEEASAAEAAAKPAPRAAGPPSGAELRSAVLKVLREPSMGPEGLHLSEIASKAGGAGAAEVKAIVSELLDDGELYNTITEEHFAAV